MLDPRGATPYRALFMEALEFIPVTAERLLQARAECERLEVGSAPELPALRAHLAGLLALRAGDFRQAERFAGELRTMPSVGPTSIAADLARSLQARLLLSKGRKAEAIKELERMELRTAFPYWFAQVPLLMDHLLRARLLQEQGRSLEALPLYDAHELNAWDGPRIPWLHLGRARALETVDRARAIEEYAFVIELWKQADQEFASLLSEIKGRLLALR